MWLRFIHVRTWSLVACVELGRIAAELGVRGQGLSLFQHLDSECAGRSQLNSLDLSFLIFKTKGLKEGTQKVFHALQVFHDYTIL